MRLQFFGNSGYIRLSLLPFGGEDVSHFARNLLLLLLFWENDAAVSALHANVVGEGRDGQLRPLSGSEDIISSTDHVHDQEGR